MTEEELNGSQIGARFEEMYSECVSKRMRRDRFGETGQTVRLLAGCFYGVLRDWPIIVNAREQPLLRANCDPVAAQDLQQQGRQDHVPIFATFTCSTRTTIRALSMAAALSRTASEMRKPAA